MRPRTEWIVAALLAGACGSAERVDESARKIAPEKSFAVEASAEEPEPEPAAKVPAELEPREHRPILRAAPRWVLDEENDPHRDGDW